MLVGKKDGRDGKRKAGMKEARVDEVLGRSGKGKRRARVERGARCARECNSELR